MFVDLRSSCQSTMMLQGEGLGIVEIWPDYTKGREREAKFRKMHSPQEMPKEVSNKLHREWCKNFSDVDSLQKLFWEKIPLQVSASPRLHGCSKYAYNVQQKLLPQHFHTRKNLPYARSPMRFQQRFAYNASIADVDIEPPCWRARQNELTNHSQAIDPNDESAIHTRSHGGSICFKRRWSQRSSQRRNIKSATHDACATAQDAVYYDFHRLKVVLFPGCGCSRGPFSTTPHSGCQTDCSQPCVFCH